MPLTISDLKSFVRTQSRRDFANYAGYPDAWRESSNQLQSQRRRVYRTYPIRWKVSNEQLIPGNYFHGRLRITDTDIDYVPGQDASMEIWDAVYDYLDTTNSY